MSLSKHTVACDRYFTSLKFAVAASHAADSKGGKCRYVSLFPLIMRLLPAKSPELASQLHHLRTGQILTPHGLRSLSLGSSLHGKRNTEHDPPYWRGPVWMNINYLVLAALDHYSKVLLSHGFKDYREANVCSNPFGRLQSL